LRTPIPTLFPFSPVNCYASNTINVWMNSAAYAGVPRILLATAGMAFLAVAGYCAMALRQILRQDLDEARGLGGLAT
jgi:hypothetical protein